MTYNDNIEKLDEAQADFTTSSGANEIDFDDDTMEEQLKNMTDEDFEEVIEAMSRLSRFFICQY